MIHRSHGPTEPPANLTMPSGIRRAFQHIGTEFFGESLSLTVDRITCAKGRCVLLAYVQTGYYETAPSTTAWLSQQLAGYYGRPPPNLGRCNLSTSVRRC
jgi:hypothetical protein